MCVLSLFRLCTCVEYIGICITYSHKLDGLSMSSRMLFSRLTPWKSGESILIVVCQATGLQNFNMLQGHWNTSGIF